MIFYRAIRKSLDLEKPKDLKKKRKPHDERVLTSLHYVWDKGALFTQDSSDFSENVWTYKLSIFFTRKAWSKLPSLLTPYVFRHKKTFSRFSEAHAGSGQFLKKNSFFFFVVFPNRLIRYKTKTLANTITHANTITWVYTLTMTMILTP